MSSTPERPRERSLSFWPREHGAYVQLAAPLVCALLLVRWSAVAIALALMACALFLAHEPFLVLLGRRGQRTRSLHAAAALKRMVGLVGLSGVLAAYGVLQSPQVLPFLAVPALLSLTAALLVKSDLERSLLGEQVGAAALTSFALPVLMAGGASARDASLFCAGWLLVHACATLLARSYVYRRREGQAGVRLACLASLAMLGLTAALAFSAHLPWSWPLALAPLAVLSLLLSQRFLEVKSPKKLGVLLTMVDVTALLAFTLVRDVG